ncbi:MAG TPA: DUF3147 family protein [Steroidobacteraceae bacterium]|nr:DUF3147 family protein [Steroidobacteraceae bacterium]
MPLDLLLRFVIGGTVVSLFAIVGDAVRPKSFAGIFGAAPSVALATLALTIHTDGASYAAIEARSMIVGAVAMLGYAWMSSRAMWQQRASVTMVSLVGLLPWLALALLGWFLVLR